MKVTSLEIVSTSRSPYKHLLTTPSATTPTIHLHPPACLYLESHQQVGPPVGPRLSTSVTQVSLAPVWAGFGPYPPLHPRHLLPRHRATPGCSLRRSWSPRSQPCCRTSPKTLQRCWERTPGLNLPLWNQQPQPIRACLREVLGKIRRGGCHLTRPALKTPHLHVVERPVRRTVMLTTMAITPTENLPHEPQCPPAYSHTTHKDTSFQVKGLE